ncbi:MAG: hypothetical protein KGK07_13105 [Chloroflexota bacterium]|nr:hypothetical protein [Chloroflexota bacterium]
MRWRLLAACSGFALLAGACGSARRASVTPPSTTASAQAGASTSPGPAATPRPFTLVTPRIQGSTLPESITAIAAYGDDVWIAADNTILASSDRGGRWRQLAHIAGGVLSLSFTSPKDGWAGTPTGLLHSRDGGASWQVAAGGHDAIRRVRFVDAAHGWLTTGHEILARTVDGGASWTDVKNPCDTGPGNEFQSLVSFINARDGWMLCPGQPSAGSQAKELFHTTDGGTTWTPFSYVHWGTDPTPSPFELPVGGYASDLFFLDAQHGWMSEERSGVLATGDGAQSWHRLSFDATGDPRADGVVFTSITRGFAFIASGTALVGATADGGATWTTVYTLPPILPNGVVTPSANAPFTLGGRTTTWTRLLPGFNVVSDLVRSSDVWAVAAACHEERLPAAKAALVGRPTMRVCYPNVLLHSSDAGAMWVQEKLPDMPDAVFALDGHVSITDGGATYQTDDGGATWVRVYPPLLPGR